jgi:hypothetical protein
MYLTPRKTEIDGVLEILRSEDYESDITMAFALIKRVAQLLSERDSYGVHAYFEGEESGGLAIGAFYDRRDAQKCLQDLREAGMKARIARLSGIGSVKAAEALGGVFCECTHRKELHPKADRCKVLPTCSCRGFKEVPPQTN